MGTLDARTRGAAALAAIPRYGPPWCRAGRSIVGLVATLVALAVLAVAGDGCGGGLTHGSSASLPKVGERASGDSSWFTVRSVKFYDQVTTSEGTVVRPRPKGRVFVVVDLEVGNTKSEPLRVSPVYVRLVRADGVYQEGSGASAPIFAKDFVPLKTRSVAPGKSARGMVAFAFPEGSNLDRVVFAAGEEVAVGLGGMKVRAPAPKKVPHLGETAYGGGVSLKVRSVTYPDKLTHGLWTTTAKKGARLVVVDVVVRNVNQRARHKADPWNVLIIDQYGDQHAAGLSVLGIADSEQLRTTSIRRGESASGKVVFGLDRKYHVKRIRYAVGMLGPPLEVAATR
jgi:hypothetical protein